MQIETRLDLDFAGADLANGTSIQLAGFCRQWHARNLLPRRRLLVRLCAPVLTFPRSRWCRRDVGFAGHTRLGLQLLEITRCAVPQLLVLCRDGPAIATMLLA
jgi:hypothetical protein